MAAVATSSSHSPSTAASAGYTTSTNASTSSAALLDEALISGSSFTSDKLLAKLVLVKDFAEFKVHGADVAIQRGIVVLVTKKFAIVESKNGSLHLWWLSAGTKFDNVSASSSGTAALTASTSAASSAMAGNMTAAVDTVTTTTTATALLTPTTTTKTVTVSVAGTGTTVEVVVTKTTAEVVTKTTTTTTKVIEPASTAVESLKRGDLTLILGLREDGNLHAAKVLFVPLSSPSTSSTGTSASTSSGGTTTSSHW
ncbi:MAG: hypothetical protein ABSA93_35135 [Streptosporangiaceae bacterium]